MDVVSCDNIVLEDSSRVQSYLTQSLIRLGALLPKDRSVLEVKASLSFPLPVSGVRSPRDAPIEAGSAVPLENAVAARVVTTAKAGIRQGRPSFFG